MQFPVEGSQIAHQGIVVAAEFRRVDGRQLAKPVVFGPMRVVLVMFVVWGIGTVPMAMMYFLAVPVVTPVFVVIKGFQCAKPDAAAGVKQLCFQVDRADSRHPVLLTGMPVHTCSAGLASALTCRSVGS